MKRSWMCCCLLVVLMLPQVRVAQAGTWQYTATRYPIVLVPGALGFGSLKSIYDYWFGITHALQDGGANVHLVQLSPLNSTEVRGEQLVAQIEDILAVTGADKVNLIGHSHGGLAARYAAAVLEEKVASVTTVASPHFGAPLADELLAAPRGINWQSWLSASLSGIARMLAALSDFNYPNSLPAMLHSVSFEGVAAFNQRYPHGVPDQPCGEGAPSVNGQRYYSWSGIGRLTNILDVSDPFFLSVSRYQRGADSDGLVSACSSHFGTVLRDDYYLNHLDLINQLLGLVPMGHTNPIAVYRLHANRLREEGL